MPDRPYLVLAATFALLGFLLVTAAVTGRVQRESSAPRRQQLLELIDARRTLVDRLDGEVRDIRSELTLAQAQATRLNALDQEAAERSAELARLAGTVAMTGPGVVVTLNDSSRQPESPADAGAYRIHDSDIQLVVNALLAAGAEALAINDNRVVSTTAVRSAGDTIVVNFRPLAPPYRIAAIGVDATQFLQSQIAQRFDRWSDLFGLGFEVRARADVEVPAYTGRVRITTAEPVAAAG